MSRKFQITEAEKDLFRKNMREVQLLKNTKLPHHQKPKIKAQKPLLDEEPVHFQELDDLPPVKSNDYLHFARPGIQYKILRNLKAGQYNVEAILDLHGKTVDEASASLSLFLSQCKKQGIRHLLIIHGKGQKHDLPILKNKLNHWLRQCEDVLAFCSATRKDGFTGALYVYLKALKGNI